MDSLGVRIAAAVVAAYLIGGIPWALIVGKVFYRIDPRQHGSGNLGATNVFRTLGAKAAIATLLLDASKGVAAVLVAGALVPEPTFGLIAHEWAQVGAMMAAVLGHGFSPYIGFKGGKGVATSAGALFVLTPQAAVIELLLFIAIVGGTRIVSLGSVIIAAIYPFLVLWLYPGNVPLITLAFAAAGLVLWLHRANIKRLMRGEESKISISRRGQAAKSREKGE